MMSADMTLPELVAKAQAEAATLSARISETEGAPQREAITALELAAVDIFSIFEARMQHHFRRGPFSRKLTAQLRAAHKNDLADRVHLYYLAINVLRHGKGASHRELLAMKHTPFTVRHAATFDDEPDQPAQGLVDVTPPAFFAGLTKTIMDAFKVLNG